MSFQTEIEKLSRERRAWLRFALAENSSDRLWVGHIDRRYAKVGDDVDPTLPAVAGVSRFGTVQRSLANFLFSLEVPNVTIELIDPDPSDLPADYPTWREIAGGFTCQLAYRNVSVWLRVLDDAGAPYDQRVVVAQIAHPTFPTNRKVNLDCRVSSGNVLGDKIPRRLLTNTDFANIPPESSGLAVPIIYGRRHNDVVAFDVPAPTTVETGASDTSFPGGSTSDDPATLPSTTGVPVKCNDIFTDDFESGTVTGYSAGAGDFSVVAGAGAAGSKAARPAAAGDTLQRTVTAPTRAFCISWSTDSDQRPEATTQVSAALLVSRVGETDVVIEVPIYGQLTRLTGVITEGVRQTFAVEGAFATENLRVQLATALSATATTLTVQTGQGAKLRIGNRLVIGTEVIKVTGVSGDSASVARAQGDTVAQFHDVGTDVVSYDANGYLKFSIDGVVKFSLANDDRIFTTASGAWSTVTFGPSGDLDNVSIGSGIQFASSAPATAGTPSTSETAPFAGSPLTPSTTPDCQPATAGGTTPSGGAVKAILVGKYSTGVAASGGPSSDITTVPVPTPTISVVGPGGTGEYQYVVTCIMDVPGAADPNDFNARNNHTGESAPSAVQHITNGPTHDADFTKDNYVHIEWPVIPGAKFYRVYGRYMEYEPFSLLDVYSADNGVTAYYNDGELFGRTEFDILKTDTKAPAAGWTSGGGGGGASSDDNIYVLAGHALKSVDEVYVLKPVVIQNFTTDGSTDPVRSEPVQVLQTEGVDYTQEIIEVNGNRYHVLRFTAAQVSETCEYYEVTANVHGIETNGDSTGTLIEDADEICEHMMLNWILNNYRSSVGPYAPPGGPWFTDVPYAPGLWDAASTDTAKAVSAARISGGYKGCRTLDTQTEARELIREMLVSWDLSLLFNNNIGASGAWSIKRFDPNTVRASMPLFDAADVLMKDTFASDEAVPDLKNDLPFFGGPTTQRTGKNDISAAADGGGWLVSGEAVSSASVSAFSLATMDPTYLKWTEDPNTIVSVMGFYSRYLEVPPIYATFQSTMLGLTTPLGTLVRVTHPDGVGVPGGWTERVCMITRSDLDLDAPSCAVTVWDMDRLMNT